MVSVKDQWVEFSFFRPQAGKVHLVGDFNDWRSGELPMARTADGYWTARMHLPAGEFRFRYFADGESFPDYAAFGLELGRFGLDSVVRVAAMPVKVHHPATTARRGIAAA